jgi:hypothetical protein
MGLKGVHVPEAKVSVVLSGGFSVRSVTVSVSNGEAREGS